jgi:cytochrome c553
MRRFVAAAIIGALPLVASGVLVAQQGAAPAAPPPPAGSVPPAGMSWAYGILPNAPLPGAARAGGAGGGARAGGAPAPAPDPTMHSVPGSPLQFTRAQITGQGGTGPADWFPGDHPVMPEVVAKGRGAEVRPCSLCHYPNGKGRPENAGVAGLPIEYFVQTMNDFRNDVRKSADPRKGNTNIMIQIAKGMTAEEIRTAAEYYGSMKWTPWIKVVEANTVAKTRIAGGMYLRLEGAEAGTEPIAGRIIETPEFTERTELLRDPRAGFFAYVPTGSIAKGQALVATGGNGRTVACGTCHGADLQGMGPVPGLAGRSPSYLARQMYDMKTGARKGTWSELMKPVVDKLTDEDFVSIAAYVASRPAAAATATR